MKSSMKLWVSCLLALVLWQPGATPSVPGDITVDSIGSDMAAFAGQNFYFVGSSQYADSGTENLSRIVLERRQGASIPTLAPMSPFELTLNGTWVVNNGTQTNGYTSGQTIQAITTCPYGCPVVVTGRNPAQAIFIRDRFDGTDAFINTGDNLFTDTAGNLINDFPTMGSFSLAAGEDYIFSDVPTRGPAPEDNTSVIVSARIDPNYQTLEG